MEKMTLISVILLLFTAIDIAILQRYNLLNRFVLLTVSEHGEGDTHQA